ncbi:MAG TPA: helix-turn-helix domain-containing protein, partial [Solirubrobacterales bacterium]
MTSLDRSDDNDLLTALRHPLRRRILRRMDEKEAISPRELSQQLQEPLSNVSYHVRVLVDCAAVTLVDTQPVRGSMQHFYCGAVDTPWARQVLDISADEDEGQGGNPDQ